MIDKLDFVKSSVVPNNDVALGEPISLPSTSEKSLENALKINLEDALATVTDEEENESESEKEQTVDGIEPGAPRCEPWSTTTVLPLRCKRKLCIVVQPGQLLSLTRLAAARVADVCVCDTTDNKSDKQPILSRRSYGMPVNGHESEDSEQSPKPSTSFDPQIDYKDDEVADASITKNYLNDLFSNDWEDTSDQEDFSNQRKRSWEMSFEMDNETTKVKQEPFKQDYSKSKLFNTRRSVVIIESSDEDDKENSDKMPDCKRQRADDALNDNKAEIQSSVFKHSTADGEKIKELIRGSNVLIKNSDLANDVKASKRQTELARALFKSVFTDLALRTHSLTGIKKEKF